MKAEIKTIEVNGVTLAYKEYGTGDKYLLSTQNFFFEDCHMALLGQEPYDYHTFVIYMRGYGKSSHIFDKTPRDYTKIWGEDVLAFAKAMGIEKFYYTGISHGNWAGWYLAFHHPEVIKAFVCVDGIARFVDPTAPRPAMPRRQMDLDEIVGNREVLSKMCWIETWPTENPDRLARRQRNYEEHLEIMMERRKEEYEVFNTNFSACDAKTQEEFDQKLSEIPFPMLIWEGGLDPLAKADEALRMTTLIKGSRLLVYSELGHGGADECPEICARDCDRYFRDIEGYIV